MAGKEQADKTLCFDAYMDAIAQAHVESLAIRDGGCGPSTKEAIQRIARGTSSWRDSGKSDEPQRGTGNGIPMKIGALAAWYATPCGQSFGQWFDFNQACIDYSNMTHYTKISAQAGLVHAWCVLYCLQTDPSCFSNDDFLNIANSLWRTGSVYDPVRDTADQLSDIFLVLEQTDLTQTNRDQLRQLFGNGSCYVYNSLPFTYAFFLRNPHSTQSLDDVINAGGDTDTNGKMLGELLGALHGIELFQQPENQWMLDGLQDYSELASLADKFCDVFGVMG